jgi:murein DD-endopeptidase MepM/ murein hydrolase activator NlpD
MLDRRVIGITVAVGCLATAAAAQSPPAAPAGAPAIEAVLVHPPLRIRFACSEHHEGEYQGVFDALGQDCVVLREGRTFAADGSRNEDYHAWGLPVLAPFDGTVEKVTVNAVVNQPGSLGKSPATSVIFRRADGVRVGYAHVDGISVKEGDSVTAGQPFAVVSNNGMSSSPHIHVGAWKDDLPLQIRWDLRALGALRRGR